jgi:hypothetical protein
MTDFAVLLRRRRHCADECCGCGDGEKRPGLHAVRHDVVNEPATDPVAWQHPGRRHTASEPD